MLCRVLVLGVSQLLRGRMAWFLKLWHTIEKVEVLRGTETYCGLLRSRKAGQVARLSSVCTIHYNTR